MTQTTLLKRVDGLELWEIVAGTARTFVIKFGARRARVMDSLEKAEALLASTLHGLRSGRAH